MKQTISRIAIAAGLSLVMLAAVLAWVTPSQAAVPVNAPPYSAAGAAVTGTVYFTDTAYAQTLDPEQLAVITGTDTLTVSGKAWYGLHRPAYLPDPLLDPIAYYPPSSYFVAWSPVVSADGYLLAESSDPDFRGVITYYNTFETSLGKVYKQFAVKPASIYYYRVKAMTTPWAELDSSRWSNIEAFTATLLAASHSTFVPAGPLAPAAPASPSASDPISVWVRLDEQPWWTVGKAALAPEETWWVWTGTLQLPQGLYGDYARHTIQVSATNQLGEPGPLDVIPIIVDNVAPSAAIGNLAANQRIATAYTIQGTTSADGAGIAKVQISFDNGQTWDDASGGTSWSYAWTPPSGQVSVYTVTSRAIDGVGNVGPNSPAVTVIGGRYYIIFPLIFKRWPPVPYSPTLKDITPDANGNYRVEWSYLYTNILVTQGYVLQEATNASFSAPTEYAISNNDTTAWYDFTNKAPNVYYYRVRGKNAYGPGQWSNVKSVAIYPGVPALNDIQNASKLTAYDVTWGAGRGAASYQLQEATSSDFANAQTVYSGPDLTYHASGKSNGTYYYRVRSVAGSLYSDWSNSVSTVVQAGFYDSFDDPTSGWFRGAHSESGCRGANYDKPGLPVDNECFWADYKTINGQTRYVVHMVDKWETVRGFIALQAPYKLTNNTDYDIVVDASIVDPGAHVPLAVEGLGIVYSAAPFVNSANPAQPQNRLLTSEYTFNGQWGGTNYKPAYVPWDQYLGEPTYVERLVSLRYSAAINTGYGQWNRLRVQVRGGRRTTFYINDQQVGYYEDKWLTDKYYVGLILSGWDTLPLEAHFDNFKVTPVQP